MYRPLFNLLLLSVLFSSCKDPSDQKTSPSHQAPELVDGRYNVGILIMDGVYNTELTAPMDIFQHTIFREGIKPMNVFLVAEDLDVVTTFEGMRILPDYGYKSGSVPNIDILVVPSAEHHLDTDLENKALIKWVAKTGKKAEYVTSHCDGAFVLALSLIHI